MSREVKAHRQYPTQPTTSVSASSDDDGDMIRVTLIDEDNNAYDCSSTGNVLSSMGQQKKYSVQLDGDAVPDEVKDMSLSQLRWCEVVVTDESKDETYAGPLTEPSYSTLFQFYDNTDTSKGGQPVP